jgi:hypothetical protein
MIFNRISKLDMNYIYQTYFLSNVIVYISLLETNKQKWRKCAIDNN